MKNKWKTGANRLLTTLYTVIRRIKFKCDTNCNQAELMQKKCRKLVLMADNAAKTKTTFSLPL
jgi:hypothetical protein